MDPKVRRNVLLGGLAAVLLVVAIALAFRNTEPPLDPAIEQAVQQIQEQSEPPPPAAPTSTFSRQAKPVERPGGG